MPSLNRRLLLAASLILAAFVGLTGGTLDRVFVDNASAAFRDRLQGHVYALIAAAEPPAGGQEILMHTALPEVRFSIPLSGLYARITRNEGAFSWQSPSIARGLAFSCPRGLARAERRFERVRAADGTALYCFSFGVSWGGDRVDPVYTFSAAETLDGLETQIADFRRNLWGALLAVSVVLLAALSLIVRWGLKPLREVAADLKDIEAGTQSELVGSYPAELQGLTLNLNALLHNQRDRLERYRNALADLAHSLKTPLALLQGSVEGRQVPPELADAVRSQVHRMTEIVDYQLQRAATSGRSVLAAPVALAPLIADILSSLDKVYAGKQVAAEMDVPDELAFPGDRGDLMEVLGNLLDNAYKWCRRRVLIRAASEPSPEGAQLSIEIVDDGPGVSNDHHAALGERGVRIDSGVHGHGIGLALTRDIVTTYRGRLKFDASPWGGLSVTVLIPFR